jgi:hypothetical protein
MKRPIMFCKIVNWATFPVLQDGEVGIQDITTPFFLYTFFFLLYGEDDEKASLFSKKDFAGVSLSLVYMA